MAIYAKNAWTDRNVSTPFKFTKSLETAVTVTLVADPTVITQAGSPISADRMNNIENGVDYSVKAAKLFKYKNVVGSL